MKQNLPVSSRENEIPPDVTLVTKTDLKGIITYANEAFVEMSGFRLEELINHNHNVVRHPDMPSAVFKDMWNTLHQGLPWQGLLKNRCKDGGYYWADACVVPVMRNDQVIGYMSVRNRAEPESIAVAKALYERIVQTGSMPRKRRTPSWVGIRTGMLAGTAFVALLMLAGGALGISGLRLADDALSKLYYSQLQPMATVGTIETRLSDSRATMQALLYQASSQQSLDSQVGKLLAYRDNMQQLVKQLEHANDLPKPQLAQLTLALQAYTQRGIDHVERVTARQDKNNEELKHLIAQVLPLEHAASTAAVDMLNALIQEARIEYEQTLQRNAHIRNLAIIGIGIGLAIVVLVGHLFTRGIVLPLNSAIQRMNRISQGDLQGKIDLSGIGESGQLNNAATVMQQHLKVMLDEIVLSARRIHSNCSTLNIALYEVTEHSESQHDRVYKALRSLDAAASETSGLSERADQLLTLVSGVKTESEHKKMVDEASALTTAIRLAAFGTEEAVSVMHQVAALIVENRGEAQRAWQASEKLKSTAEELKKLVDYFEAKPAKS